MTEEIFRDHIHICLVKMKSWSLKWINWSRTSRSKVTIFQKNYQSQLHPFELQLAKSEKEKVLAEETKKRLQDYPHGLESRENNEAENLKEQEDNHILSFLHLKNNWRWVKNRRWPSSQEQSHLKIPFQPWLKNWRSSMIKMREAEVSQNLQETINQKNLRIEGLQKIIQEKFQGKGLFQGPFIPIEPIHQNPIAPLTHSPFHSFRFVRLIFWLINLFFKFLFWWNVESPNYQSRDNVLQDCRFENASRNGSKWTLMVNFLRTKKEKFSIWRLKLMKINCHQMECIEFILQMLWPVLESLIKVKIYRRFFFEDETARSERKFPSSAWPWFLTVVQYPNIGENIWDMIWWYRIVSIM